jgi:hypothetical protein
MDINAGCETMGGCINNYSFTAGTYSKEDILDALHTTSDHLPVVVDYTLTGGEPQPLPEVLAKWRIGKRLRRPYQFDGLEQPCRKWFDGFI